MEQNAVISCEHRRIFSCKKWRLSEIFMKNPPFAYKRTQLPWRYIFTAVWKIFDISPLLNFNRDGVPGFACSKDVWSTSRTRICFSSFPKYNSCIGMNETMWIWMQDSVGMPPFLIMLPTDFSGQKRTFPPDGTFQLLRGCVDDWTQTYSVMC